MMMCPFSGSASARCWLAAGARVLSWWSNGRKRWNCLHFVMKHFIILPHSRLEPPTPHYPHVTCSHTLRDYVQPTTIDSIITYRYLYQSARQPMRIKLPQGFSTRSLHPKSSFSSWFVRSMSGRALKTNHEKRSPCCHAAAGQRMTDRKGLNDIIKVRDRWCMTSKETLMTIPCFDKKLILHVFWISLRIRCVFLCNTKRRKKDKRAEIYPRKETEEINTGCSIERKKERKNERRKLSNDNEDELIIKAKVPFCFTLETGLRMSFSSLAHPLISASCV